jgi:hypothetical protein
MAQATLARKRTLHVQQLQQIRLENDRQITLLQNSFSKQLANVSPKKESPVEDRACERIQRLTNTLTRYHKRIDELSGHSEPLPTEHLERVKQLSNLIEQKKRERYAELEKSKTRITESMSALEDMEDHHEQIFADRTHELNNLDRGYANDVQTLKSAHECEKAILRQSYEKVKKKAGLLQKTLHELVVGNERELRNAMFEFRGGYETDLENVMKEESRKIGQKKWSLNRIVRNLRLKKEYVEVLRAENWGLTAKIANWPSMERRSLWTAVRN